MEKNQISWNTISHSFHIDLLEANTPVGDVAQKSVLMSGLIF